MSMINTCTADSIQFRTSNNMVIIIINRTVHTYSRRRMRLVRMMPESIERLPNALSSQTSTTVSNMNVQSPFRYCNSSLHDLGDFEPCDARRYRIAIGCDQDTPCLLRTGSSIHRDSGTLVFYFPLVVWQAERGTNVLSWSPLFLSILQIWCDTSMRERTWVIERLCYISFDVLCMFSSRTYLPIHRRMASQTKNQFNTVAYQSRAGLTVKLSSGNCGDYFQTSFPQGSG